MALLAAVQSAIERPDRQDREAAALDTPGLTHRLDLMAAEFSIIQRKARSPNDSTDLAVVEQRRTRAEIRYNAAARPFKWKFTTTDLADLLDRLDRHQQAQTTYTAQSKAA